MNTDQELAKKLLEQQLSWRIHTNRAVQLRDKAARLEHIPEKLVDITSDALNQWLAPTGTVSVQVCKQEEDGNTFTETVITLNTVTKNAKPVAISYILHFDNHDEMLVTSGMYCHFPKTDEPPYDLTEGKLTHESMPGTTTEESSWQALVGSMGVELATNNWSLTNSDFDDIESLLVAAG